MLTQLDATHHTRSTILYTRQEIVMPKLHHVVLNGMECKGSSQCRTVHSNCLEMKIWDEDMGISAKVSRRTIPDTSIQADIQV